MDSENQKQLQEQQAAEVRQRRLQWAERAGTSAEADAEAPVPIASSTMLAHVPGPPPPPPSYLSNSSMGQAEAGSLALSPPAQSSPLATAAAATGGSADSDTIAVLLFNGKEVKELLRSIAHLLAQRNHLETVGSSPHYEMTTAVAKTPSPAGLAPDNSEMVQVISNSDSSGSPDVKKEQKEQNHVCRLKSKPLNTQLNWSESLPSTSRAGFGDATNPPRAHSQGLAPDDSEMVQVISDSDSSGSADVKKEKKEQNHVRRFKSKPLNTKLNWRESLPSTSHAGFRDATKPPTSGSRRPGKPKASKSKRKRNESSDSETAADDNFDGGSSDCEDQKPAASWHPQSRRFGNKKGSLLCNTTAAGIGKENCPPPKRGPGRPKGSKNKKGRSCASQSAASESSGGLVCHICREGRESGSFCITDCGHAFHKKCLDRWLSTSSQKYRSLKTCPYCGGTFEKDIPLYG